MALALASSASVFASIMPPYLQKPRNMLPSLQVKAHKYEDDGKSSRHNMVDSNLGILRKRIEEIKAKEKLERCYEKDNLGWNHARVVQYTKSRISPEPPLEYIEMVGTMGGIFGLTILGGTLGLCLASVLLHFNQLSMVGL